MATFVRREKLRIIAGERSLSSVRRSRYSGNFDALSTGKKSFVEVVRVAKFLICILGSFFAQFDSDRVIYCSSFSVLGGVALM